MKNIKLLTSALLATLVCPIFGNLLNQTETTSVVAESEVKDMSEEGTFWKASEGNFISVDDWLYSGKGYSFEFKFKDGVPSNRKSMIGVLCSGDTALIGPAKKVYLFQIKDKVDNESNHNYLPWADFSNNIGSIEYLSDDWFRYSVNFSEFSKVLVSGVTGHETLNGLNFQWVASGYWNDLLVRNMHVTEEAPYAIEVVPYEKNRFVNSNTLTKLPVIDNFFKGDTGFAMTFHSTGNVHGTFLEKDTSNPLSTAYYLKNGNNCDAGKLFNLGDDWYRYELLPSELTPIVGKENASLGGIQFDWDTPNDAIIQNGFDKILSEYELITKHSYAVTFDVDGVKTTKPFADKAVMPQTPTKEGYHFVEWCINSASGSAFDFDSSLTQDITLYAKFEAHSYDGYDFNETQHWKVCSCGEALAKENHTFNQQVENNDFKAANASCNHGTIYYYSCVCGAVGTETFEIGEGDPTVHDYGELTLEIDVPATCESDGHYIYHSDCKDCGETDEDNIIEGVIEKTGHNYEVSGYTLSEDKSSATLTLVCKNDSSHTQTINAAITKQTIAPQVGVDGVNIYTLTGNFENKTYTKVVEEIIPAIEPQVNADGSGGCGGSLVSSSILVSSIILIGVSLLTNKKRKEN